ncbi:MAG: demethoxyubiquinone hydroxylase family protein [Candidatus Dactylopiibacterium carminicum]|uniref:3-demethoxyubiquinol 3-hydroxylase n=1 Tax=Candidatus Dactylopiibacterium carminicum TaxID=857335 RepID=A0A272EPJ0_9RHOO|nr:2-polyprenyl-3-methyl-6-methoxy-1,4-benzoquinone monooxygenase [Candidatus Dactylopiibacterium carminicum]KAF7598309.1 demethoxyubiquinone hydroxylase family protein [Candidatus Dactylopiibacterium carminicum]PAS92023.1 MAG: demethoxyubiquinone hydroxylase family protein [Candidatus Dactylopiibacterium carminicum]PAS95446.1 MAG: demethoxyubiquinone hydroxylase family protein [Candidatus Dactylopiibacterium carminicum]PAS97306.1 MAG: demethoxyubiquinone hydroxylase family protein [Candidatus 
MDRFILHFDRILRTLAATPQSVQPTPGAELPEASLSDAERAHMAGLMRVNHVGEVCAQALYQGQAMTARDDHAREALDHAAHEEVEHLAWTQQRIRELGGRTSLLNPLWYGGALSIGVLAGIAGDRWSLGFVAETERQVEAHLNDHLAQAPESDGRSRAIIEQMRDDEHEHAEMARAMGGESLPQPVQLVMRAAAKVMTTLAYRI